MPIQNLLKPLLIWISPADLPWSEKIRFAEDTRMERLRPMAQVTQGPHSSPSKPAFFPLLHSVFQKLGINWEEKQEELLKVAKNIEVEWKSWPCRSWNPSSPPLNSCYTHMRPARDPLPVIKLD